MTNIERESILRKTLVIFFLIDTSASMAGVRIGALNSAIEQTLEKLREMSSDSADAEIKIALLEFSSGARWLTPNEPVSMEKYHWNDLDAGGGRDMGEAFRILEEKLHINGGFMQRAVISYAPIIFLMTDGEPTDEYKPYLMKLKDNKWFKASTKVALAIGDDANENILIEFTGSKEAVVRVPDGRNAGEKLAKMVHFIAVATSQVDSLYYPVDNYSQKSCQDKQFYNAIQTVIVDDWYAGFSCPHDKQLFQALQRMQSEIGGNILSDSHKFKSVIADLLPNWENKTIRKRVIEAVELGVYARLEKASKINNLEKERLHCIKLLEEDGIRETLATEIVGAFTMLIANTENDDW